MVFDRGVPSLWKEMAATEEEKKHLMDEVEPTATKSSPKKDGTRLDLVVDMNKSLGCLAFVWACMK